LSILFYNFFLLLYKISVRISSLFNPKAEKWLKGRKNIFERLRNTIPGNARPIWIHCSSLGEFEQGRPVIEKLRKEYPGHKILLTFFSPSGYEEMKGFTGSDWVFYLPLDGPVSAKRFLSITSPCMVLFVKYEFWYYYLKKIRYRDIPLILISASFRKNSPFFKWYGFLQRKMLSRFNHLFVQNESSKELIDGIGLSSICSVSGDTRFDRVIEVAEKSDPVPFIEKFLNGYKCIIAGSTWEEDEYLLSHLDLEENKIKLIIAPHEINEKHITGLKKIFQNPLLYSVLSNEHPDYSAGNTLIIDSIGLLSRLYRHASIAYIGGGFKSSGIHNVLEAAVYGKPVLFGPNYKKFNEAVGLIKRGGGFSVSDTESLEKKVEVFLKNENEYSRACRASENYVQSMKGATQKIIQYIQENRLLIN